MDSFIILIGFVVVFLTGSYYEHALHPQHDQNEIEIQKINDNEYYI